MFSPDFFIRQGKQIFVVEIKDDSEISDPSPENIKKHEYATEHFKLVNKWLNDSGKEMYYQFNMLTPRDYSIFFEILGRRKLVNYRSHLDANIFSIVNADNTFPQEHDELSGER